MRGVVVRFDTERGFGFIRIDGHEQDVFVHVEDIPGHTPLGVGQTVMFDVLDTDRGPRAQNVVPGRRQLAPEVVYSLSGLAVTASLMLVLALVLGGYWLGSWLAAVTVVAFLLYGWDKQCARRDGFRVPEGTLHAMAILGGSIGAFAGQRMFHHKTRKASFQIVFWAIVAVQAAAVLWYVVA